eukprot:TRINITY_DN29466_c0_g1_i2.p1 TRINITY_DN29466_c0_g1~~TRINITY_DN29466_c0_g1_i2.p1  ORF type:complete len:389 (-),score=73.81 TRINITY_DN29466_c0_g1_i2:101-1267(-)
MLLLAAVERHEAAAAPTNESSSPYPFDRHQGVLSSMLAITNEHRHHLGYPAIYQLQIVELYLRLLVTRSYAELRQELKFMLAKARKVSVLIDDYMQNSSKMHRRISQWFTRVGLHHRSEVFLGPFMLDMVIGDKIVVEIDGPTHFYRDTNSRTASSLMKDSMLTAMGFHVKHLPYQEWQQCGTAAKRMMYCSSFWKEVLVHEQAGSSLDGSTRSPQLVDILDMVGSWQAGSGPHPSAVADAQNSEGKQAEAPAFYRESDLVPLGGGHSKADSDKEGVDFDIDSERVGLRTPEELLEAHQRAESSLEQDRQRELSARKRWQLDMRLNGGAGSRDPKEELRTLLPRSKRQVVSHTGSGFFDYDELELDTDSSSDEEDTAAISKTAKTQHG